MGTLLKILGIMAILVGLLLSYKPDLLHSSPMPSDAYLAIERRVKWGFLIGLGTGLCFHPYLWPWRLFFPGILMALILGIIIARLFGFALDGFFVKQLQWLAIECVTWILFAFWYFKVAQN